MSTTTASVSTPVLKFKEPLETAIYNSLASKLIKIERMDAPRQLAYTLSYSYNKDGVRGTQLLVLDKAPTTNNEIIYTSGNHALINSTTTYKVNDTFAGATVLKAYENKFGQMPTLLNFGRAEVGVNQKTVPFQIDYSVRGVSLGCEYSRKLRATLTIEALQDIRALYGEKFRDKISSYLYAEIFNGIDAELLQYMREKATVCETLDFDSMKEQGFYDVPNEVVAKISPYIDSISLTTMKPDKVFIIGTPDAIRHLIAHPAFVAYQYDENEEIAKKDNKYKRGTLYGWDIYSDVTGSTIEDYILIGSCSNKDSSATSAILGIYNQTDTEIVNDYETADVNVIALVQYDIKHNPLDNDEKGNSSFLKLFKVSGAKTSANPQIIN